jgi:hypothetical protein
MNCLSKISQQIKLLTEMRFVGSEALTAVTMNGALFWDMKQCCPVNFYRTTRRHIPEDNTFRNMRHYEK